MNVADIAFFIALGLLAATYTALGVRQVRQRSIRHLYLWAAVILWAFLAGFLWMETHWVR